MTKHNYPLKALSKGYQNRLARLVAVQNVYAIYQHGELYYPKFIVMQSYRLVYTVQLAQDILNGMNQNVDTIDQKIQILLPKDLKFYDILLLICLRLAVYEVVYTGVEKGIIIKDYLVILDSFFDQFPQHIFHAVIDKIKVA